MAHVQKSTKSAVGGLTRHYARHKISNNEYVQFSNQDIDTTKTHLNYNLAVHQKLNQLEFIKQRTSEVHCPNRKELNIMCSWVVTKPKQVTEEEQKLFFQETYNFLEKRYGKENVISSYVHLDEVTPHLHFAFIPIIYDKKKEYYKVCAKEVINRADLKSFHTDLTKGMEKVFKRDVGIKNEATKDGNKSIKELKSKSIEKINNKIEKLNLNLEPLRIEYETKKEYVKAFDKASEISMSIPSYAKVKEKGILKKQEYITVPIEKWEQKHISANEKSYLKEANNKLESEIEELKSNFSYIALKNEINNLKNEIEEEKELFYKVYNENIKLKKEVKSLRIEKDLVIDEVNEVLNKLPGEETEKFIKLWEDNKKNKVVYKNKGYGLER